METAILVLAILGCVFGLLGFILAAVTAIIVIGWKNSTHKIVQVPAQEMVQETVHEIDAPPAVRDQIPSSPEPLTLNDWVKYQQANSLDTMYQQNID